jgi:hypothetical protein
LKIKHLRLKKKKDEKVKIMLAVRELLDYSLVMDTTSPTTKPTLKEKVAAAAKAWNDKLPLPMVSEEVQRKAHEESMLDYLSRSPKSAMD